jgi:hypothetical protein
MLKQLSLDAAIVWLGLCCAMAYAAEWLGCYHP